MKAISPSFQKLWPRLEFLQTDEKTKTYIPQGRGQISDYRDIKMKYDNMYL